jgi:hypothetical protein
MSVTFGNPPARDANTTLGVCLPRATKTSGATGIHALARVTTQTLRDMALGVMGAICASRGRNWPEKPRSRS